MYFEIILSEGFRKNGGYVKDDAKKNLKKPEWKLQTYHYFIEYLLDMHEP